MRFRLSSFLVHRLTATSCNRGRKMITLDGVAMLGLVSLFVLAFAATPATGAENVLHSFSPYSNGWLPFGNVCLAANGMVYGNTPWGGATGAGVVYKVDKNGRGTVLHTFTGGADGTGLWNSLTCQDGSVYGTTIFGGSSGAGVVFRLDGGEHFTVLYTFTGGADGNNPSAGITPDSDGNLYGMACSGGAYGQGAVFKLDKKNNETVLYNFTGGADGGCPGGSNMVRDGAGNLYGSAYSGGSGGAGVVFKLDRNSNLTVLYSFTGGNDGGAPNGVVMDAAGNLYGTTGGGGAFGAGVVFKIDSKDNESTLYSFTSGNDGGYPYGAPVLDPAGNLYGTTDGGGSASFGTVFKIDANNNYSVLYTFTGGADGGGPSAGLILDSAGNLYGPAQGGGSAGLGALFKVDPSGHETVVYGFPMTDGNNPSAGVVADGNGNLYGSTVNGGDFNAGTVFKDDGHGKQSALYTFTGGTDGYGPGGLIRDSDGNLYGGAGGGSVNGGMIFKLDLKGQKTVLYNFTGGADGLAPNPVIQDSAGNFYGTTLSGGSSGVGVVFKLDTMGHETVLHTFSGADGAYPYSGVVMDSVGNLYGTTSSGGPSRGGVVYKLDTAQNYTILHAFTYGADGGFPWGVPILDSAGNLYGTTWSGGPPSGDYPGVVYKVTAGGQFSVLYTFTGFTDGGGSRSNLVLDSEGNLYGTTEYGGQGGCPYFGCGVLFMLDPMGHQTVLYSFSGGADGAEPGTGLIRDAAGDFYSTTQYGGATGAGVVYQITPGMSSPTTIQPVEKRSKAPDFGPYGRRFIDSRGASTPHEPREPRKPTIVLGNETQVSR